MRTVLTNLSSQQPHQASEEFVLLALLRESPDAADLVRAQRLIANGTISWERLIALARHHRVHPLMAHRFSQLPAMQQLVPDDVRLLMLCFKVEAISRRSAYLRAILPVLRESAVPVILMKGAALVETLYPPGTRTLNDFDILVTDKSASRRLAAAFQDRGYSMSVAVNSPTHEVHLHSRVGHDLLAVDLHWQIYDEQSQFKFDLPGVEGRAQSLRLIEVDVLAMSPEDLFVHLSTQFVRDRFKNVRLQRIGDLQILIHRGLCWATVCAIAERSGALGATLLGLRLAIETGAFVPDWVLGSLKCRTRGTDVIACFVARHRDWLFWRARLPSSALPFLQFFFHSSLGGRAGHIAAAPARFYRRSRLNGRTALKSALLSLRFLFRAVAWSLVFAIAYFCERIGARNLAARIRRRLWQVVELVQITPE